MIRQRKLWMLKESKCSPICHTEGQIPSKYSIVDTILGNRGLLDRKESFLQPVWEDLHDPFLLCDMDKAVKRIEKAIQDGEKVFIYGDYDADGITATALMLESLRKLGAAVDFHIPDRIQEGYGLNNWALKKIADADGSLVISVDSGISGHEQAVLCRQLGLDLIVTDHHEPGETIPDAYAVINPKRKDCDYPNRGLSGVGVAFKLIQALGKDKLSIVTDVLDLVALGTVADIVPLLDENRFMVHEGLKQINEGRRMGLQALLDVSGANGKTTDADTLGFILGPRVNAAGRIGCPADALQLLLTQDKTTANELATRLDQWNRQRQQTEADILEEVLTRIKECDLDKDYVIVVDGEGWHPGVIGIVSSRITEQFGRPSIILTRSADGSICKGSGRSIDGFNLYEALKLRSHCLVAFGGHDQAAGLSLRSDMIDTFRTELNAYAKEMLSEEDLLPAIVIDAEIPIEYLTLETAEDLLKLAPFGEGNRSPMFLCRDLVISEVRTVGSSGDHLKLRFAHASKFIDAIAFSFGDHYSWLSGKDHLDVVFSLDINHWNGRESLQLMVRDLKASELPDNLSMFDQDLIHIDALENQLADTIETQNPPLDSLSEYRTPEFEDRWGSICRILREALSNGNKTCVLVNTREQARHIRQLIMTEGMAYSKPIVLHGRLEISLQEQHWNEFISGSGNPLIFTGFSKFLKRQPGAMNKLICLFPFFTREQYTNVREWAARSSQSVEVYYLFGEKQLLKNMQVLKQLYPDTEQLRKIYTALRNLLYATGENQQDLIQWSEQIQADSRLKILPNTFLNALTVFQDLGLVHFHKTGTTLRITWLGDPKSKLNLDDSPMFSTAQALKKEYQDTFMNFHV